LSDVVPAIGSGLVDGMIIAMVAVSFTLIYNATGVVNFTNGQLMVLGGYLSWWLQVDVGLPFIPTVVIAVGISAFVGFLIDRVVIGPLRDSSLLVQVTGLIALASVMDGVFRKVFGAESRNLPAYLSLRSVVPGLNWSATDLVIIGVTLVVIAALMVVLYRTPTGSYMRAAADNPLAAGLVGVNPNRVAYGTWALGAAMASLAGVLILPRLLLSSSIGLTLTLLSFAAVVLGGFGSLIGAIVGGLLIGVVQAVVARQFEGGWEPLVSLVLMMVVLTARPSGLFRAAT
jgi:branched-chain amino acid transport system permease protein